MVSVVERVGYGRSAAEGLASVVATAKREDALAPVTVLVSSNHLGVTTRRLLASGALGAVTPGGVGMAAVSFSTVYRLAELLASGVLAGRGLRPVSTPVIAGALRECLRRHPGVFARVAGHPATETALVAAYRELRDVSEEVLERLGARGSRVHDVVRLQRQARQRLAERFSDEQDLLAAARRVVEEDPAAVAALGTVVVYLPQRLGPEAAALLRALAERTEVVVLCGTTGEERADAQSHRTLGLLGREPPRSDAGERPTRLPGTTGGTVWRGLVGEGRTSVVTTSDADEEVRVAVRKVVDAARRGTPLERIAVLYPVHDPYARTVHEHLAAADIAHNGAAVVPSSGRVAGRTLLGLLDLATSGFRREDVTAWLAGAPLRDGAGSVPVRAWERLSRDAGVVRGRDDWDRLPETLARRLEAEAELVDGDPDRPEWKVPGLRRSAALARALRRFVLRLIDDLELAGSAPATWGRRAAWARHHLENLLGEPGTRWDWPPVEVRAAERVQRALDRLAGLDEVEGPVDLEVFARTLRLELEADLQRVGRLGEGVLVGSLGMGVGLDLDLVVVLGMAEGLLPSPLREDALLPEAERRESAGELPLRAEEPDRQLHALLATLAGAREHVLSAPRGDLRRSSTLFPSRWLVEVAGVLEGEALTAQGLLEMKGRPWLEHEASLGAGLRRAAFPATGQEHRLRQLLERGAGRKPGIDDLRWRAGAEMVAARRSTRFTRFDGNLEGQAIPSPVDGPVSATRLERWAGCPFAYFVGDLLDVDPVESPEDRLIISPLDLGSLVHEVLERFVSGVLSLPEEERPEPGEAWSPEDRTRLLEVADEVCADYEARGLVGRPLFWRRDRAGIVADLERFLDEDNRWRAERRARPVAAEFGFGSPGTGVGTADLRLRGGRCVRFRGRADRLDVAGDGTLLVIDYKTGKPSDDTRLSEENPDRGGKRLQLVVYALAARAHQGAPAAPVRSDYWFVRRRNGFKRIGYMVSQEVLDHVAATVETIVAGIEHGTFPAYPTGSSTSPFVQCRFCDPDGLGVVDLQRRLRRKQDDPALARFLEMAEG